MIRVIDHAGITVPDPEAVPAFLAGAFGRRELDRLGPFAADDGWMARRPGVDARARIPEIAALDCGGGARIEVFAYEAPHRRTAIPRNSDPGGHHLAFHADDLGAALERAAAHGATVADEPTVLLEGPSAGETWVSPRAPWGLQPERATRQGGREGGSP